MRSHGGDLSVSVGIFFLNSSFNPSKGSHEKEAGSDSGSRDVDVTVTGGFQPVTVTRGFQPVTVTGGF
jgi:hypothetical protein